MEERDVIIIGSGPAGLTAAIYTSRAHLNPIVIEGYQAGGQLMITSEVENFPGFKEGINGPDLMAEFRLQAQKFGSEFVTSDVTKVELSKIKKTVWIEDREIRGKTVIIATGATANYLGLENETRLKGRGVSACATCDGFFFQERTICVIGGGDSAMEEAIYLTRFAKKIYLIHRRDQFRASKIMVERAKKNPKIEFVLDSIVTDVLGEDQVQGVKIKNNKSGKESTLDVEGMFLAIGHTPNTTLFRGQLDMDKTGYIMTSSDKKQLTATNIPGVFACGDVQDSSYRQAITAAGSGCMAALDAERYLEILEE